MLVFAVFDSKVGGFLSPIFCKTPGVALRAFVTAVTSQGSASQSDFARYSEDYSLFELGSFDEEKGQFTNHTAPVLIITGPVAKSTQNGVA